MSKLRNWAVNKAIEMKVRQEEGQGQMPLADFMRLLRGEVRGADDVQSKSGEPRAG